MTYQELYEQLGSLTPEQRQQEAELMTEQGIFSVTDLWVAAEDHINPTGEGAEPKSNYLNNPESLELLDGDLDDQEIVIAQGEVFLLGEDN